MTSERASRRRWLAAGLLALAAGLPASCAWLTTQPEAEVHALAFNHAVHVGEAVGLECSECHAPGEDPALAGTPALAVCLDCHEGDGVEENQTYLAGIAARPAEAPWVLYSPDAEVVFSHAVHAEVSCAACHGDVGASEATGPWVVASMATCTSCHQERAPERMECATCHATIRADVAPDDHRGDWAWEHGARARFGDMDGLMQGECSYCHQRNECTECHRQVPPRSHDHFFRLRGHGLLAENDRQACAACHEEDSCVRCHRDTTPASHRGAWGSSSNMHCVGCHQPLGEDVGCALCHTDTRSHDLAPPRSPRHVPGLDCRQCHGRGGTLPHPDDGSECTTCHR